MENWGMDEGADETITVAQLDEAAARYAELRKDAEAKKAIRDEAYRKEEDAQKILIDLLKRAKKTNYTVEGIGKFVVYDKLAIKNPETAEDRRKFFAWVESKFGQDGLDKYQVTNYMAINALYNDHVSQCEITGEDPTIDGLGLPTATPSLRFTKTK